MIDTNNPKISIIRGLFANVLSTLTPENVKDYFTEDAILFINEKKLQGHAEIEKRVEWIKNNNFKSVTYNLKNVFFDGDQGFTSHTVEPIFPDGNRALYRIFGYIKFRDLKICHYELNQIQLEGKKNTEAITATT